MRLHRLRSVVCATLLAATAFAPAAANPDPDAALDAGFGDGGVTALDFGAAGPAHVRGVADSLGRIVFIDRIEGEAVIGWLAADGRSAELVPLGLADVRLFDLAVAPDDGIVVAGAVGDDPGADVFLARLLPDGTLDETFGDAGVVVTDLGGRDGASAVALDGDGVVVSGASLALDGSTVGAVVRYQASGWLDPTFGDGGVTVLDIAGQSFVSALDVAVDAAHRAHVALSYRSTVARLRADGDLDATYGTDGFAMVEGSGDYAHALALQPDGKAVVVGQAGPGMTAFGAARFDTAGRLDPSFGSGGTVDVSFGEGVGYAAAEAVAVDPQGRIVAAGWRQHADPEGVAVVRWLADGRLDETFGDGGCVLTALGTATARDVVVAADGRITTIGHWWQARSYQDSLYGPLFARYLPTTPPSVPPPPPPTAPPPTAPPPTPPPAPRSGYWMLGATGAVYAFGDAAFAGSPTGRATTAIAATPSGQGYWVVEPLGGIHPYGDARYFGAHPSLRPGEIVTALSPLPGGDGYWLFSNQGRAFAYGAARHHGDMGAVALNGPVIGSVATPTGRGYYMVAADGGIFAFGDAAFRGSMGATRLNKPVVGLAPDRDGSGYWLVAGDGGIFAFDAAFRGSMGATTLNRPVVGAVAYGDGYLMVASDGGIFNFSTKPFAGSLGDRAPADPIVAVAVVP